MRVGSLPPNAGHDRQIAALNTGVDELLGGRLLTPTPPNPLSPAKESNSARPGLARGGEGQIACFFDAGRQSLRSFALGYNPWPLQGQRPLAYGISVPLRLSSPSWDIAAEGFLSKIVSSHCISSRPRTAADLFELAVATLPF